MFHFCNITKALGDENRLRILMILRHCSLCVCQLTALLDLSPSTTSKHLSVLRQVQLIECVKNGRWIYYQLPQTPANDSICQALQWVQSSLAQSKRVLDDSKKLKYILETEKGAPEQNKINDFGHSAYMHILAEQLSQQSCKNDMEEESL